MQKKENVLDVFDRKAKTLHRERAAAVEDPTSFDYIKEEIGYRVADRVMDVRYAVHSYLDALFGTKNSTKLFPLEHYFPLPLFSVVRN